MPREREGKKAVLRNIRLDQNGHIYATLNDPASTDCFGEPTVIISATLDYILIAIEERGYDVEGVEYKPQRREAHQ